MTQPTHYDILGVRKNASKEEIKKAFRECSKHYHPDANPSPNAALMFRMVAEAKDILLDDGKRREYDESLEPGSYEKPGSGARPKREYRHQETWESEPYEMTKAGRGLKTLPIYLLCGALSLTGSLFDVLGLLLKIGSIGVAIVCYFRIVMTGFRFVGGILSTEKKCTFPCHFRLLTKENTE